MPLSRRQARRQALFLLYQWDLSGQPIGSQFAGEIDPWARGVAETVAGRAEALDERITHASVGWTADRLGTVERSALRVAVHELDTHEVPAEVAINEAVGRPPVRGARDARVELLGAPGDRLGDAARPRVDLTRVLRADLLAGEVPLVEQEQRLPARLAPRNRHTAIARSASRVDVE